MLGSFQAFSFEEFVDPPSTLLSQPVGVCAEDVVSFHYKGRFRIFLCFFLEHETPEEFGRTTSWLVLQRNFVSEHTLLELIGVSIESAFS